MVCPLMYWCMAWLVNDTEVCGRAGRGTRIFWDTQIGTCRFGYAQVGDGTGWGTRRLQDVQAGGPAGISRQDGMGAGRVTGMRIGTRCAPLGRIPSTQSQVPPHDAQPLCFQPSPSLVPSGHFLLGLGSSVVGTFYSSLGLVSSTPLILLYMVSCWVPCRLAQRTATATRSPHL